MRQWMHEGYLPVPDFSQSATGVLATALSLRQKQWIVPWRRCFHRSRKSARICDWPAPEDPPGGWAFPVGSGGGGTRDFALRTLPASSLDAVKRAGNLQEETVNDVLLAAYFLALCRTIGRHRAARCQLWYPFLRRYLNDPRPSRKKIMICNQSVAFAIQRNPARTTGINDRVCTRCHAGTYGQQPGHCICC